MVHRIASDISVPFFAWKKLNPIKNVFPNIALDTETIKGACFIISDSDRMLMEIDGLKSVLSYLNNNRYRKSVNWFYNLEYDLNSILTYLPFDKRKEIATLNTTDIEGYRIKIIPKKEVKIGKISKDGKMLNQTSFYDLAQFYDMKKLSKLAKQTSYKKVYVNDISNINYQKYKTNKDYNTLINDRCIIDCKITKELADKFTDKISPIVRLNKYKSKASIARRYVLENLKHSLKVPSESVIQCALNSYHAGHIEACKLGIFKNIKNYDLNSAYTGFLAELYDTNGILRRNNEYEPETAYSFYLIDIEYYDNNLSPLWYNTHSKNYHPNGKIQTWVCQSELEFYMDKGYDYKIIKAYHIMKRQNHEKPFHDLAHDLYNKRLEAKDAGDPIEYTYKVILSSIYGATINIYSTNEESDKETSDFTIDALGIVKNFKTKYNASNMFNPLFAAYITANTRMKLFNDFYKQFDKIIAVSTDGVFMTSGNGVKVSKKLGDYSLKPYDKIMSMGSGRNMLFDNGNLIEDSSTFRSIPKSPTEIYELIQQNKHNKTMDITRDKPIKLKESIKQEKYRDKFNQFVSVTKTIHFKTERRHWFDQFDLINDIFEKQIESRPFTVKELI